MLWIDSYKKEFKEVLVNALGEVQYFLYAIFTTEIN